MKKILFVLCIFMPSYIFADNEDYSGQDVSGMNFSLESRRNSKWGNLIGARGTIFSAGTEFGSGTDYTNASFGSANLAGAIFSGANLAGSNFENSSINGANFSNANLVSSDFFIAVDFTGADFTGAVVTHADFSDTTRNGFTKEQLYSTRSYKEKSMQGMGFLGNNFDGWDFSGQDLTGADFCCTSLSGTNFDNAIITNAMFNNSSYIDKSTIYSTKSYKERNLMGVSFLGLDISSWDLSRQCLMHAVFNYTTRRNVKFSFSDLRGSFFDEEDNSENLPIYKNTILSDGVIKNFSMTSAEESFSIRKYVPLKNSDNVISAKISEKNSEIFGGAILNLEPGSKLEISAQKTLTVHADGTLAISTSVLDSTQIYLGENSGLIISGNLIVNIEEALDENKFYKFDIVAFEDNSLLDIKEECVSLSVIGEAYNDFWYCTIENGTLSIVIPEPSNVCLAMCVFALGFFVYKKIKHVA